MRNRPDASDFVPFNPAVADGSRFIFCYNWENNEDDDPTVVFPIARLDDALGTVYDVELLFFRENRPPVWRPFDAGINGLLRDRELFQSPLADPLNLEILCTTLHDLSSGAAKYSLYASTATGEVKIVREEIVTESPPPLAKAKETSTGEIVQTCPRGGLHEYFASSMINLSAGGSVLHLAPCLKCSALIDTDTEGASRIVPKTPAAGSNRIVFKRGT